MVATIGSESEFRGSCSGIPRPDKTFLVGILGDCRVDDEHVVVSAENKFGRFVLCQLLGADPLARLKDDLAVVCGCDRLAGRSCYLSGEAL